LHYHDVADFFPSVVKTSYNRTEDHDRTSSHIVDDLKKCCINVNSVQLLFVCWQNAMVFGSPYSLCNFLDSVEKKLRSRHYSTRRNV